MITRRKMILMLGAAAAALPTVALADKPLDRTIKKGSYTAFPKAEILKGSARDRGVAYGKLYKSGIREFLDQEIYRVFTGKPWSKNEMLKYAADCAKVTRDECPTITKEFEGIAEGAEVAYEEIILINLHEELRHQSMLPLSGHCTAAAVAPVDSGNEHTYVGQTWDWMVSMAGKSAMTEWRRDDAPNVLYYGFPGMPAGAGINAQGIAFTWTSAKRGTMNPRVGVPSYMLVAHLLAQKDLESIVREANRNMHAGWFTILMADEKGNLLNIEGYPEGIAFENNDERMTRVGFATREITNTPPGHPVKIKSRGQHMYDLLKKTAGKNDLKTIQSYFTERKHEIVQWDNPRSKTIDVMVFDTKSKTAHLSRGPDFKLEWREFRFNVSE